MSALGGAFWEPSPAPALTGDGVRDMLLRCLEENAFSAAGLDLCRGREAERLGQQCRDPQEPASRPVLAHTLDACAARRGRVSAEVVDMVQRMGLVCHEVPVAVVGGGTRAAPAPAPSPAPLAAATMASPAAVAPTPAVVIRATPAPTSAPTSALAKLVAAAKAKQQEQSQEEGGVHPQDGESTTAEQARKRPRAESGGRGDTGGRMSGRPLEASAATGPATASGGPPARGADESDEEDFAVPLPLVTAARSPVEPGTESAGEPSSTAAASELATKHPSQMTREEFLSQFKRAPRRGEVGQSAEEIAKAQQLGYVMSGSRSIGAQMYVDRVQRQLHEREAGKLQQQFRKVEDERMDSQMIEGMLKSIEQTVRKEPS